MLIWFGSAVTRGKSGVDSKLNRTKSGIFPRMDVRIDFTESLMRMGLGWYLPPRPEARSWAVKFAIRSTARCMGLTHPMIFSLSGKFISRMPL